MKRKIRTKGREGQALVEFALVLPVLVILLVGIMEFGLLLYNQQVITNASREGARYGIVARTTRRSATDIEIVVNEYCGNRLITFGSGGGPETVVDPSDTDGAKFGEDLSVTVSFQYDFLVLPNFVGALVGGTNLQAQTSMKYE